MVTTPGEHPVKVPRAKTLSVDLHHMSWSLIRTEALMEQANKSVSDPDQAWILAEFIRYLEHPRSGAIDFDDMGPFWVKVREGTRTGALHPQDKGVAEVADRFGQLISFAAMQLSRKLGVDVSPALTQAQLRDPAGHLQEAISGLAATARVHGALRVPDAVAPIKVTADLRAALVHCAVTVPAPRVGRPTTRVNWLARQLKDAPADLCIEAVAARLRGKGPVKTLADVRTDPSVLAGNPKHELRAFTLSLTSNADGARGQGHGSFVKSALEAVDKFYADVVQRIKPWAAVPPKAKPVPAGTGIGGSGAGTVTIAGPAQPGRPGHGGAPPSRRLARQMALAGERGRGRHGTTMAEAQRGSQSGAGTATIRGGDSDNPGRGQRQRP
jgi:hypothetical protein